MLEELCSSGENKILPSGFILMLSVVVLVERMIARPPLTIVKLETNVFDPLKVWVDDRPNPGMPVRWLLSPKKAEALALEAVVTLPPASWSVKLAPDPRIICVENEIPLPEVRPEILLT